MTTLLAIETSSDLCSVALACDGGILDVVIEELRGHSRHPLPAIDRLLAEAGLALGRLDAIVVSDGPGSFTGLRIGIGVAQGLAYGADLPAVQLTTDPSNKTQPAFSPDGARVAFTVWSYDAIFWKFDAQ